VPLDLVEAPLEAVKLVNKSKVLFVLDATCKKRWVVPFEGLPPKEYDYMDEDIHHEEREKTNFTEGDDEEVTVFNASHGISPSRDESMNDTDVSIFMTWRNNIYLVMER
jgi:hypothetical protein